MSLLTAITWDDNANITITLFINPYYLWVCVQFGGSMFHKSGGADCATFYLLVALCLYRFTYCFHMIKQYLLCKSTTFPSHLTIFA